MANPRGASKEKRRAEFVERFVVELSKFNIHAQNRFHKLAQPMARVQIANIAADLMMKMIEEQKLREREMLKKKVPAKNLLKYKKKPDDFTDAAGIAH